MDPSVVILGWASTENWTRNSDDTKSGARILTRAPQPDYYTDSKGECRIESGGLLSSHSTPARGSVVLLGKLQADHRVPVVDAV